MRRQGWEAVLAREIEAARTRPFQYGEHDCLTWAFGVRAALVGIDDAGRWRGRYSTEIGAARLMKKEGVTLLEIGMRLLGTPLTAPLFARRGDIAFRDAYGVVMGEIVVYPGENGLVAHPLWDVETAWRV